MTFKIIDNDIYFKNVKVATFNKLVASFRDEVERALKHNFYSEAEIENIKEMERKHET